jgi:protein phosphatase
MIVKDYICDVGLNRNLNEDTYLINQKHSFVLVSDGMGGHERGDIASDIVVKAYNEVLEESIKSSKNDKINLVDILNNANESATLKIKKFSKDNKIQNTMGATIAGIYFDENNNIANSFHLGDSRVYRISNNIIEQVTEDHSVLSENKNILSKAIGNFNAFKVDIESFKYNRGDYFLICTDGIYNYIEDNQLLNIIINNKKSHANLIKKIVYENSARDNLTLVIVEV